jgi:hypothetical protein
MSKLKSYFVRIGHFLHRYRFVFLAWGGLGIIILLAMHFQVDKQALAVFILVYGFLSHIFVELAALIALIPIIGPLLVKVFALPIFWIFNALGYFVSIIAIKWRFPQDSVNYRTVSVILLLGAAVGFIIGRLI